MRAETGTDAEDMGQDVSQFLARDNPQTTKKYLRSRKPSDIVPLHKKLSD